MIAPALEPWGWIDSWPAWSLYATQGEQVVVLLPEHAIHRLPERVRPYLLTSQDPNWRELEMGRWSIECLSAPIYPQSRFQIAVARAFAAAHGLEAVLRVVVASRADRYTGERAQTVFGGERSLEQLSRGVWLNTQPRRVSFAPIWSQ